MKKLLFIAVLSLMTSVVCKANIVHIINLTNCTFRASINGGGGYTPIIPPNSSALFINCPYGGTAAKVLNLEGEPDQVDVDFYHPTGESISILPCMNSTFYCKWDQLFWGADATLYILHP